MKYVQYLYVGRIQDGEKNTLFSYPVGERVFDSVIHAMFCSRIFDLPAILSLAPQVMDSTTITIDSYLALDSEKVLHFRQCSEDEHFHASLSGILSMTSPKVPNEEQVPN